MHPLTKEALNKLKTDNIVVSPEDAILLDEFAKGTSKISDQKLLNHSGRYCGNVEIFPLTIGAETWLRNEAYEWFCYDEQMYYLCYFYAIANSRYPERFVG